MISVVVADDSALVRRLVSGVLNDTPDIRVVGVAHDGAQAIEKVGGTGSGMGGAEWVDAVSRAAETSASSGDDASAGEMLTSLVTELAVEPMPVDDDGIPRYIVSVLARLQEIWVGEQVADIKSRLKRMSPRDDPDGYNAVFGDLVALEAYRRSLQEQALDPTVGQSA